MVDEYKRGREIQSGNLKKIERIFLFKTIKVSYSDGICHLKYLFYFNLSNEKFLSNWKDVDSEREIRRLWYLFSSSGSRKLFYRVCQFSPTGSREAIDILYSFLYSFLHTHATHSVHTQFLSLSCSQAHITPHFITLPWARPKNKPKKKKGSVFSCETKEKHTQQYFCASRCLSACSTGIESKT